MTDVSKVHGPSGSPESSGKKERANVDADRFKKEMQKVKEVSQVDPDEQKKRKRREESEDEAEEQVNRPPEPTPPNLIPHFSLEQEAQKASPFEIQSQGPGISPVRVPELPRPDQLQSTNAFMAMPPPSELEDESGPLEQESFIETFPSQPIEAEPLPPPQQPQVREIAQPTGALPAPSQPLQQQQTNTAPTPQPSVGQKPSSTPAQPPSSTGTVKGTTEIPGKEETQKQPATPLSSSVSPPPAPSAINPEKGGTTASELEQVQTGAIEETAAFYEQMKPGAGSGLQPDKKLTPDEIELEADQTASAQGAPVPFAQQGEEEKEKREKKEPLSETSAIPSETAPPQIPVPGEALAPQPLSPYTSLSPQMMDLFDRMVGVMTVMNVSGMSETTFTLNSPQFASSVFFGAQIIIQEFSTAPKQFNVQLKGSPQAVALFQSNTPDLMSTFQGGNFGFRVNRLETVYQEDVPQEEKPLFKRKEQTSGEQQEHSGDA